MDVRTSLYMSYKAGRNWYSRRVKTSSILNDHCTIAATCTTPSGCGHSLVSFRHQNDMVNITSQRYNLTNRWLHITITVAAVSLLARLAVQLAVQLEALVLVFTLTIQIRLFFTHIFVNFSRFSKCFPQNSEKEDKEQKFFFWTV